MKVKNIVRSAAAALDLSGAVKYCDDGDESGKAEAEELLRLYCETEKDVAVNYMPILFEEKTSATDGKIEYAALSKPFLRTAYLLSESGERASYRAYAGYLKTETKKPVIGYAYVPADKTMTDDCEYATGVPAKVFVMGIVAAYYLEKQLFEEAAIYRKQYEASLALVRRVHGVRTGGRIRARRWQ